MMFPPIALFVLSALCHKIPEHIDTAYRVQMCITPYHVLPHSPVKRIADTNPPAEPICIPCSVFQFYVRVMEFVPPECGGTHRTSRIALPCDIADHPS